MWFHWVQGWKKIFPMKHKSAFIDNDAILSRRYLKPDEYQLTLDELAAKYPCSKV